ncbi:MAG: tRNA (guanosine(46)-N7)-methyltransferase TrmB [Proteobacteria bacterium]|nr:MAG: tRNA (guanosine(46)-N7)-methyltransferase TrmB [Pseudomonadota bacterium]
MPNFQTKALVPINYPYCSDDIRFEWEAKSGNESLILTKYKGESFFIKKVIREKNILIKGDKLSKPSRVKYLQDALKAYEKATEAKSLFSNIHTSKNRLQKHSAFLKDLDFFAGEFRSFSKKFEKICIEVGFGSGRHLLFRAKEKPNTLHVAIEIHKPSIEQVTKQCELQGLENVILIDCDARVLMEFFASNSVEKIFVHFPIPWDEKPHRRVISKNFINEATRVLQKGGRLEIRSDSDKFFDYSYKVLMSYEKAHIEIRKNEDLEISSKYEDRWKRMQKNIYDLHMINSQISQEREVPSILSFDFEVGNDKIQKETKLGENWFVHFETKFEIDEKNYLWRVAFGDASHVEHCYIRVLDGKPKYFPKNLYASKNNLLAHKFICERMR